jgi:hypothetical protein
MKIYHPILFAIFPVLFLYSHNASELYPIYLVIPTLLSVGITGSIWIILNRIVLNRSKAAFLTSTLVLIFYSLPPIMTEISIQIRNMAAKFGYLTVVQLTILKDKILWSGLVLFVLVVIFSTRYIFSKRIDHTLPTKILNRISLLLVLVNIVIIFTILFTVADDIKNYTSINSEKLQSEPVVDKPDIYYIILDRYAGESNLKVNFGFDNSDFIGFLKTNNFNVNPRSKTNYPYTHFSLASSLNMQHVNKTGDAAGYDSRNLQVIFKMIRNNKVQGFLRSHGYTYIHMASNWQATRYNHNADITYNYGMPFDDFFYKYVELTPFYPIIDALFFRHKSADNIEGIFKQLKNLPNTSKPKFVFAHMLIPHPPYLFNKNGDRVDKITANAIPEKVKYLNYLQYGNTQIKDVIKSILARSKKPPVIILQADEGPYIFLDEFSKLNPVDQKALQIRTEILNAYYLPNSYNKAAIYDSITPVNSFRVVFNQIFKTNLELVSDDTFISPDPVKPYNFINITSKLNK